MRRFAVTPTTPSPRPESLSYSESLPRIVTQIHYTTWPDHGTSPPKDILALINLVNTTLTFPQQSPLTQSTPSPPILVHCSAGVGRTGTFILCHILHTLLTHAPSTPPTLPLISASPTPCPIQTNDPLILTLHFLRCNRVLMVQTREQFRSCYQVLELAFGKEFQSGLK